ncbi:MAG: 4'-phosphopantetheinyl transferase superfamily protein [Tannerella sp.]|jgi:phosphopantetheinyl transferase|nr:4'-phosphopantetheinyl transferase superfamily protein [Tannerella sp.]
MALIERNILPLRGVWKIDESTERLLEHFRDDEIIRRVTMTIRSESRRREWLAVRCLTDALLGERTEIYYMSDGSPLLADSDYHISISHTRGYAAVVLDLFQRTGIDIEYHSERAFKLRSRFLDEEELSMLDLYGNNPGVIATLFWCAKETFFKALGQQQVNFIKQLKILPSPSFDDRNGDFMLQESYTGKRYPASFKIEKDYVMSWMK